MERTREIGILKSMGASKLAIVSVVLRETTLLAVVGILLGIAGAYLLKNQLHAHIPDTQLPADTGVGHQSRPDCALGAIFGALYPALKAARKDPIDALSYE